MSDNYGACSICGAKIRRAGPGESKFEKFYDHSPLWDITQYFCEDCTKKLNAYIWNESEKALKKGRRQAKLRRTKQRIMSITGGTK